MPEDCGEVARREQIIARLLVIALLAVPILIQVYVNSTLACLLNRAAGEAYGVAAPSALIGASNFFELAVAASCSSVPTTRSGARWPRDSCARNHHEEDTMTTDAPKVHVHMKVSNLEKSRAFYENFLGSAPVKVKPGYVKFLAPFGPLNLALSEVGPAEGRGHVDHLGLQVESGEIVRRELARVKEAGLPVREEMSVNCCHANQDKFWVEDPDGVEWEVYVLNYDIADDVAGCATPQPITSSLGVVKGAPSCCAPSR